MTPSAPCLLPLAARRLDHMHLADSLMANCNSANFDALGSFLHGATMRCLCTQFQDVPRLDCVAASCRIQRWHVMFGPKSTNRKGSTCSIDCLLFCVNGLQSCPSFTFLRSTSKLSTGLHAFELKIRINKHKNSLHAACVTILYGNSLCTDCALTFADCCASRCQFAGLQAVVSHTGQRVVSPAWSLAALSR